MARPQAAEGRGGQTRQLALSANASEPTLVMPAASFHNGRFY